MRKALIAVVLCLAACASPQVTQAPTSPSSAATMHDDAKRAMAGRVFPQTLAFGLTEPVNLSETLHQFAGGPDVAGPLRAIQWGEYLEPLNKLYKLQNSPPLIEVMAVEKVEEAASCDQKALRPLGLRSPFVCRENDPSPNSTPQEYLMVAHVKLVDKVNEVTAQAGAQAGWQAATMATAVVYSQFLQQLYGASAGWPNNRSMESCVAGMSARMVFPQGALTKDSVTDAMVATDGLLDVPSGTRSSRVQAFMQGFTDGQLASCTWLVPSVPTSVSLALS